MSSLVSRPDTAEFRKRPRWLALVVILGFLTIVVRLFYLQVIQADENQALARENIIRRVTLATTRGVIRDAYGRVLAASRPSYNVYCVPSKLDMKQVWPRLANDLNLPADEREKTEKRIKDLQNGPRKDWQILVKEDISRDAVAVLETHIAELPGIDVVPFPVRYYPNKDLVGQALGFMAEIDGDTLMRLRTLGYVEGDRRGVAGIERGWESYLRGTRGWQKVVVDARGRRHPDEESQKLIDDPKRRDPVPGRDLRLSLDLDLQKALAKSMRGHLGGAGVVVEVRSGRILAMYSKPSYDPNELSGGNGVEAVRAAFRRLQQDPLMPLLDKTMSGAYPPGSTFKPFSALAALGESLVDPNKRVNCRGFYQFGNRVFKCTHVHGPVDMHEAIVRSCNVYFYQLGEAIGMDRLAKIGLEFGFGQKTGLGTNPEAAGRMPTRAWYAQHYRQFRQGFTLNAAIGQGATTVTPLQLALAYAALANDGTLYEPQIVRAVETADGTVVQEFAPRVRRRVNVQLPDIVRVRRALWGVVNEEKGTVYHNHPPELDVAGKTGTAQVSHRAARNAADETSTWYFNRDHAWFVGYAPSRSPEIAVVVLIEHGGFGGVKAAPVVFDVIRAYERLKAERAGAAAPAASAPKGTR
jgi:penicillin-binding protein 2